MHWLTSFSKRRRLHVGATTDAGMIRSENQDAFGRFTAPSAGGEDDQLFIVADGMGGHSRGQEASRMAVDLVQRTYFADHRESVTERLKHAFEVANAKIFEAAQSQGPFDTMGTTCTAIALVKGHLYLAHIGDSRAYRITPLGVEQLTHDHTYTEALRSQGLLSAEEAQTHPNRHMLTRALGVELGIDVDLKDLGRLQETVHFLICSDGLAEVPVEDLKQIVVAHPPQEASERLIREANAHGGRDNITALVLAIA